ncbi:MAG: hypothetical protein LBR31_02495 [Desulfovibrio sp.]|jgi:hypothetical protein|nr:hypothetical protein [Desulfovibrio sp.]
MSRIEEFFAILSAEHSDFVTYSPSQYAMPDTTCVCDGKDVKEALLHALSLQRTVQRLCDEIAFLRVQDQRAA